VIVAWLLLQGCAPRASETTASCDVALDDRSVGAPFRQTYCTACHASGRSGAARFGAPEGMDFDDRDALMAHAERVRARVREAGTATAADLAEQFAVPRTTLGRLLRALVEAGDLATSGQGKATRYQVAPWTTASSDSGRSRASA
jgi:hypothetical protein